MNQKKLIQIAIITVVGVWVFCLSTIASVTVGRKMLSQNTTAPIVTVPTTVPTTTAPTTTAPSTTRLPIGGNIVTSQAVVEDPEWLVEEEESKKVSEIISEVNKNNTTTKAGKNNVPSGKSNIIKAYVDGVNELKNTSNFSLYKDDKLNVTIDKMPAEDIAKNMADNLLAQNQKEPITYNFVNGVDSASGKSPNEAIAPLGVSAAVEESAVSSANATATSDGGYKVTLLLVPETQTYTAPAKNHATMVEVVDVAPLIPDGVKINTLDMSYTDTKIEATFNKDGELVSMVHYLKVEKAVVNVTFLMWTVEVQIHGDFTSNYTFSY